MTEDDRTDDTDLAVETNVQDYEARYFAERYGINVQHVRLLIPAHQKRREPPRR